MANAILILILITLLITGVILLVRWRQTPEKKLLRDFRKLRKMILKDMDRGRRKSAKRLLGHCESHLDRLVAAKEQQHVLLDMAETTKKITGRAMTPRSKAAVDAFDEIVADNLTHFFTSLTRISSVVALQEDEALNSLKEFADDLEAQREELARLTLELQGESLRTFPKLDPGKGSDTRTEHKETEEAVGVVADVSRPND